MTHAEWCEHLAGLGVLSVHHNECRWDTLCVALLDEEEE